MAKESPSQTAGPYVHIGCVPSFAGLTGMYGGQDLGAHMITADPAVAPEGEEMVLTLTVLDGDGVPLQDALLEFWQAGPEGHFGVTPGFSNWGRAATHGDTGIAEITTLKPGAPIGQAPHILLWIVARGINLGLTTRLYFPDEDNDADPVFALAGDRAGTMVATKTNSGYSHVIRLQGTKETVFFDV